MSILVIHPKDPTTDFLSEIYKDMDCTLVNYNINSDDLNALIESHDRIIMMGHGDTIGLLGFDKLVINRNHVESLRNKPDSVYIWCKADSFMKQHDLKGFGTGMIISQWDEAIMFALPSDEAPIEESNQSFSNALKESIHLPALEMADTVKRKYREGVLSENKIFDFNYNRIYHIQ